LQCGLRDLKQFYFISLIFVLPIDYIMNEISVRELKEKIDKGEDIQIVDVREPFEYEMSNIGGDNIPLAGILIESDKIDTEKPVIMVCRTGRRSGVACMQLEQLGYDNLYNLEGGLVDWAEKIEPGMQVY
jgi:rhodanese-related sulfurtransferase